MNFRIEVWFTKNGERMCEKYTNVQVHSAVRRTKRKHKNQIIDIQTVSYVPSHKDVIPDPPEGWDFARFKVKMKKNRFGNMVSAKAELLGTP